MRWVHIWLVAAWCAVQGALAYRLPEDLNPHHYDLKYTFDIDPRTNFSFYGVAEIQFNVKSSTDKMVLHAEDFQVSEDMILVQGPQNLAPTGTNMSDTHNLLTISLNGTMNEGENYTIVIPFYGNLKAGLDGVYISTYINKHTKTSEYLIATHFQSISARKGFPCFDEPMYKATYTITIGHHRNFSAISNMPQASSANDSAVELYYPWIRIQEVFKKNQSDFVWDTFEKSVPMSTYLVAFAVAAFSFTKSPSDLNTTEFRIWTRKDASNQAAFAATMGPKVLSYFEQWFDVPFPLPKQDMIAIPDFAAGAMENWGLITYEETFLLFDEKHSSFTDKEKIAEVIAHELSHQWFGNLVTMKWWSDLWLNEGFATFAASAAVNKVEPTWQADKNYAVNSMLTVLTLDALESSHPVSVDLDDPKRIEEIFDEISYGKGSTVIRMMTMFLGDEVFRKAIKNYLVKYSYSNAEQDDLWRELTAVSQEHGALTRNVTVKQIMDTWTTQTGYPILTVTRDYSDKSLNISQKRYFSLSSKGATGASWWVPLSVACETDAGNSQAPLQWLAADEGVHSPQRFEHESNSSQWVLFNHNMIALYRVNYDQRNWELLSTALRGARYKDVPVLGRVQLMSDAFALAWTNHLDYNTALGMVTYLQQEREYLPIITALKALEVIENMLKRTLYYGAFQKFVRKIIGEIYGKAGGLAVKRIINGHDLNSVKIQVLTSDIACRVKVPGCEEHAVELFQQWMDSPDPDQQNPIPLDLRRTVYCVGVSRGSVLQWRFALARERRANVAAARDALLQALTCTKEVWILTQYLEWAVSGGEEIRRQNAGAIIKDIIRSTIGYYVAKDFIYDRILDVYNATIYTTPPRPMFQGSGCPTWAYYQNLGDPVYFAVGTRRVWREQNKKYLDEYKFTVERAIENAKVNIDWVTKNGRTVVNTLRELTADGTDDLRVRKTSRTAMSMSGRQYARRYKNAGRVLEPGFHFQ